MLRWLFVEIWLLQFVFNFFFLFWIFVKVENLLSKFHARVTSRLQKDGQLKNSRSRGQRSTPPSTPSTSGLAGLLPQAREDEEVCPICLLEMVEGESLTSCQNGCNNRLHQHCMEICKLVEIKCWPADNSDLTLLLCCSFCHGVT